MSEIAEDIITFDVVGALQYVGSDAVRKRVEEWFSSFRGSVGYEIHDLSITVEGDVAFSHSLNHVSATKTDGREINMCWRATACYRKIGGKWMVMHEHNSVPFDVENGRASLNLKP